MKITVLLKNFRKDANGNNEIWKTINGKPVLINSKEISSENQKELRRILNDRIKQNPRIRTLNKSNQVKHRINSKQYFDAIEENKQKGCCNARPSIVSISDNEIKQIIFKCTSKNNPDGEIRKIKDGTLRIFYRHQTEIGIYVDINGNSRNTKCCYIHMSKNGSHIVPARE